MRLQEAQWDLRSAKYIISFYFEVFPDLAEATVIAPKKLKLNIGWTI